MIIRNNELFYRSKEQQHYFNCPFQLGGKNYLILVDPNGNQQSFDTPSKAFDNELEININDNILIGFFITHLKATDGLFDNLFDNEIISFLKNNQKNNLKITSDLLLNLTYTNSIDEYR
jgi:protein phosphatase PTC7